MKRDSLQEIIACALNDEERFLVAIPQLQRAIIASGRIGDVRGVEHFITTYTRFKMQLGSAEAVRQHLEGCIRQEGWGGVLPSEDEVFLPILIELASLFVATEAVS